MHDVIYQSDHLRAALYRSSTPSTKLLCEFDYLDNKRDGFPPLLKSPSACERGFNVLKIDTSANNWFLSDDILELGVALEIFAKDYHYVVGLCMSMGIMPALIFSRVLNIQKLMAFSPVVSIFGDDIDDKRFRSFQKYITNPDARPLWKNGNKNIEGVICYDPATHPIDRLQANLIINHYSTLKPLAMPYAGHPCFQIIKEVMGFKAIQDLVLDDRFEVELLRDLHKECRRQSNLYEKRSSKNY